ncbi:MAG: hypothetical protein IPF47_23095 [Gemmatimonadetes bacterium]|nr:hypothetical protein [Gemmatimonadota bacterium]
MTQLLTALTLRGDRPTLSQPLPGCVLGAALFEWQSEWAGTGVGRCGPVTVAADATLYYVDDLVTALRHEGVAAESHYPADLIAAAIRAWGERAVEHLEGDYAFVALRGEGAPSSRRAVGTRGSLTSPPPGCDHLRQRSVAARVAPGGRRFAEPSMARRSGRCAL